MGLRHGCRHTGDKRDALVKHEPKMIHYNEANEATSLAKSRVGGVGRSNRAQRSENRSSQTQWGHGYG